MPLRAGLVPLTQLGVRLGFASPTLRHPLLHWEIGKGKGEGVARNAGSFIQRGRPPGR
jgi:hypothetical protein